ncbi:MAG: hypothetical protein J0M04_07485, partial [Verrucomicrobia bacterium]|nr:hypothetical protein [Verrucomicrobiota bacterium]
TTAPGALTRSFTVDAYQPGLHPILARVPETGEIIAKGNVNAFILAGAAETDDAQCVDYLAGGGVRFSFTMVADAFPPNGEIHLRTYYQGAVFGNGSRDLILRASDFDENGIANIYMEWAAGAGSPRTCHSAEVFLVAEPDPQ